MFIPQGHWIVVMREVRDTNRGIIVKAGLTEAQAKIRAEANKLPGWNAWAMHKESY